MSDRFEKFTERARKVLTLAHAEAQRFNHNYIGTEHLLLGMVAERDGVAARVLNNMGVELPKVRSAVESVTGRGERAVMGEIGLTPRAVKVIELAVDEARRLNHHYIGTEHLLLGIVREGEGIAAGVLESLGVSLEKVRQQVIQVLNQSTYSSSSQPKTYGAIPFLDALTFNLTKMAHESQLDTTVGRATEVERIMQIFMRRTKNNPLLIGEPGVGKTSIVNALANELANRKVPAELKGKTLLALSTVTLLTFLNKAPDQAATVIDEVFKEIASTNSLLFIPDIDLLVEFGANSIAGSLKTVLANSQLQVIATTTQFAYDLTIMRDSSLAAAFSAIQVKEPTVEEAVQMLHGIKNRYEEHHKVSYSDDALEAAVELSAKHVLDHALPGKAVDLMDEAASRARMLRVKQRPGVTETTLELVTRQDIVEVLAMWTGLSVAEIYGEAVEEETDNEEEKK